jgi:hypothetical protein
MTVSSLFLVFVLIIFNFDLFAGPLLPVDVQRRGLHELSLLLPFLGLRTFGLRVWPLPYSCAIR